MTAMQGLTTLSSDDCREAWDKNEKKYGSKLTINQQQWNNDLENRYRGLTTDLRAELNGLTGKRNALAEQHTRLTKELALVEHDLRYLRTQCEAKSNDLVMMEEARRWKKVDKYNYWEWQSRIKINFFCKKRGEAPLRDTEPVNGIYRLELLRAIETAVKDNASHTVSPPKENEKLVNIVDANSNVISSVQRIEPWNQWADAFLKLPVPRDVIIRKGLRFHDVHLATMHEHSEARGVKWLSCMIKAVGEVQSKRCYSRERNQEVFEKCIIVGGNILPNYGNCEWNRQCCRGASGERVDIETVETFVVQREEVEHKTRQRPNRTHQDEDALKIEALRSETESAALKQFEALQQQQRRRQRQREPDRWERPLESIRRNEKPHSPISIPPRYTNECNIVEEMFGRDTTKLGSSQHRLARLLNAKYWQNRLWQRRNQPQLLLHSKGKLWGRPAQLALLQLNMFCRRYVHCLH